jgi:(R)-2-hydroxyacyl-CoA dehydratese activating ATPase
VKSRLHGGCDVGSTTSKAVIMNGREIVATSIVPSKVDPEESANAALEEAIKKAPGLDDVKGLAYLVGTGYGRTEVPFADRNISEISCHAMGAHFCESGIRSIVDIGGQDIKAISLNDDGSVLDFAINDKCAAGTGRFFESMAHVFGTSLEEFSDISLRAKRSVPITSQCSVFAESEVFSLISRKVPPDEIALGIQESVAKRCYALLRRIGLKEKVAITGGCAKNLGLAKSLAKLVELDIVQLSVDPQLMGALGACIFSGKMVV